MSINKQLTGKIRSAQILFLQAMRLRSLDIKGFKSFAEKTQINFEKNITGIVGPNGCGKSNVVDAIRWVLGEQKTKQLRLEKMDNIIFNGSKDKAASNIAEVSLTLDNTRNLLPTEFQSVTITRIVEREGDSEYKLNGVTCRLKDIRDLFMDTGISTDSYAIIELKMIDQILNNVDNARRTLIEQAAGVSKYKTRKKETLNKLSATEADLNRVEDLLFEIDKNLKSLETQAKKARQYKNYKEEYKIISIDLSKYELHGINESFIASNKEITEQEDLRLEVNTQIEVLESGLEKEKLLVLEKEKSLSEHQKLLNHFLAEIQESESTKKMDEQKSAFLRDKINQLNKQIEQTKSIITSLVTESESLEKYIADDSEKLEVVRLDFETAKQKLEDQRNTNLDFRTKLDEARQKHQASAYQITNTEKQIAVKESQHENLMKRAEQSLFENEERLRTLESLRNEIKQSETSVEKHKLLVDDLRKKEEENLEKIKNLEEKNEQLRQELTNKNRTLDAKNNEYKLTKNMIDNLEGFPESIKFLKKNVSWLKDTPLLSDIIYTEEKYRIAIESVLQPYLNNFIVEKENEALNAIDILSQSSAGKAGFLILDYFKSQVAVKQHSAIEHAVTANDVIQIEDKYKPLLTYLLQGIFIANEGADVNKLFQQLPDKKDVYIISNNGHLLKSDKQISGGAVGLFEGKRLGRTKNLEILEKDIKKLETEVLELKKVTQDTHNELQTLKVNSYRNVIEREDKELQNQEKQLVALHSKLESEENAVGKVNTQAQELRDAINALLEEINPLKENLAHHIQTADADKNSMDVMELDFRKANEVYNQISQEYNQSNILFIQQENKLKSNQQTLQYKQSQLEENNKRLETADMDITTAQAEISILQKNIAEAEELLVMSYKEKDDKMQTLSAQETDYYKLKDEISNSEETIREKSKYKTQIEERIAGKKDLVSDLKLRLNVLKERLSIEFHINPDEFTENLELPETPKDELQDRIDKVKRRIENFGEVNPMAEEAYNEMKDRYDFINTQKQDLLDSKANLLETMLEIENTAKGQFMETFNAVRENFIEVFRSMFTEDDNCDLILVNPDDPLESEIDIIAKPKGKRPQSINQLSGGEKTLTALSLLFGLYLYKPAPFCILDEVDAPLDDTNIKKFNDAIRKFSQNSQFIIVTHNKSTMASVDNIYGVTMVKQGISRVVPVDFSNLN
ncbi:MAG TPA: chromosome segregation protein SMC [Chitinophagales bacterium]|nr:chromosome segregation protein SMC [Chitinophagales bacterium]